MFRRYQMKLMITAIVLPIVLLCMGVAETARCFRALLGPSTISYADACSKGLAGYGYVRITGVHPAVDKASIIVKKKVDSTTRAVVEERWAGVYVPIEAATDTAGEGEPGSPGAGSLPGGPCSVLAWLPSARNLDDVLPLDDLTDLTGFVDSTFSEVDPSHQGLVLYVNRARGDQCWIVRVRSPSWLKGLGLTLGSLVIPGLFILWKSRNPL